MSSPLDASNKPKVDKFAALAAAQQQKATSTPPSISNTEVVNNVNENEVKDGPVDMILEDEVTNNNNQMEDMGASSSQVQSSDIPQQQLPAPPRRDKFASMAMAAAATETPTTTTDGTEEEGTTVISHSTAATSRTAGNGKFAAALQQKQLEEQKQEQQRYIDMCHARDYVWNDCDMAEDAVTDLLKYAEQTTMILSQNTTTAIHSASYVQSKVQLSKLIQNYQSTVVQVHDLLAKHAHHVQAYNSKKNLQQQRGGDDDEGTTKMTTGHNSLYTQRVEHRLAETKRRLLQDLVTSMNEENDILQTSMNTTDT